MKILVTGGAGFIGSNLIRFLIQETDHEIVNVDKLTYAGNLNSLADLNDHDRLQFEKVDIVDADEVQRLFQQYQPDGVMHLAAESHVDRSIDGPGEFVQTNIVGTFQLAARHATLFRRVGGSSPVSFSFSSHFHGRSLRFAGHR